MEKPKSYGANPKQQFSELLKHSHDILIVTHEKPDGDALGGMLGLYLALLKLGKNVTAISSDPAPDAYSFLPTIDAINTQFRAQKDFIVTIDTTKTKIDTLKYSAEDNKVNIVVTPQNGNLTEKDVSFSYHISKYDLIVAVDAANLELIGKIYEENRDLFSSVPVVNIDHHPTGDYYGKINIVDPKASSACEVLTSILEAISPAQNLIDEDVATCLLAGIITDTDSFQLPNTSPKTLSIAASLLGKGGRQGDIIKNIYKTRSLSSLKLWGRILSNIQFDNQYKIVWSYFSKEDMAATDASEDEKGGIIQQMLMSVPTSEIAILLNEQPDGVVKGSIRTIKPEIDGAKIAGIWGGGGHIQAAGFKVQGKSLQEAEQEVLEVCRDYQKKRKPDSKPGSGVAMPLSKEKEAKIVAPTVKKPAEKA